MKINHSRKSLNNSAQQRYGEAQDRLRRAHLMRNIIYPLIIGTVCALAIPLIIYLRGRM